MFRGADRGKLLGARPVQKPPCLMLSRTNHKNRFGGLDAELKRPFPSRPPTTNRRDVPARFTLMLKFISISVSVLGVVFALGTKPTTAVLTPSSPRNLNRNDEPFAPPPSSCHCSGTKGGQFWHRLLLPGRQDHRALLQLCPVNVFYFTISIRTYLIFLTNLTLFCSLTAQLHCFGIALCFLPINLSDEVEEPPRLAAQLVTCNPLPCLALAFDASVLLH